MGLFKEVNFKIEITKTIQNAKAFQVNSVNKLAGTGYNVNIDRNCHQLW